MKCCKYWICKTKSQIHFIHCKFKLLVSSGISGNVKTLPPTSIYHIYLVIRMVTCLVVTFLHTFERKIFFSIKWWEKHHHNLLKAKQSSIKIYLEKWKSYYINNFMVPTAFSLYSSKQPFSDYIIKTAHYDHLLRSKLLFSKSTCILSYSLFVC